MMYRFELLPQRARTLLHPSDWNFPGHLLEPTSFGATFSPLFSAVCRAATVAPHIILVPVHRPHCPTSFRPRPFGLNFDH